MLCLSYDNPARVFLLHGCMHAQDCLALFLVFPDRSSSIRVEDLGQQTYVCSGLGQQNRMFVQGTFDILGQMLSGALFFFIFRQQTSAHYFSQVGLARYMTSAANLY